MEFLPFDVLVGKGLDDADAGQGVLEPGVYVADFFRLSMKVACMLEFWR